jgi:phospholipid transport system substrate-binding protein
MKRLGIWLCAAMVISSGAVKAQPEETSSAATNPATASAEPETPVANPAVALRAGIDKLLTFLNRETAPDESEFAAFLDAEIAPFFDFDYMAKTAGGRMFARLSAEEQAAATASIKASFLGKMAERLTGYTGQEVRFLPPRAGDGGRTAQVSAAILNPGSYPARLDFRLYHADDSWRVYDVAANGQSAIVHYRREMMRQLQEQRMRQMRRQWQPSMATRPPVGLPPMGMPWSGMPPAGAPRAGFPIERPVAPAGPTSGYGMPYSR